MDRGKCVGPKDGVLFGPRCFAPATRQTVLGPRCEACFGRLEKARQNPNTLGNVLARAFRERKGSMQ